MKNGEFNVIQFRILENHMINLEINPKLIRIKSQELNELNGIQIISKQNTLKTYTRMFEVNKHQKNPNNQSQMKQVKIAKDILMKIKEQLEVDLAQLHQTKTKIIWYQLYKYCYIVQSLRKSMEYSYKKPKYGIIEMKMKRFPENKNINYPGVQKYSPQYVQILESPKVTKFFKAKKINYFDEHRQTTPGPDAYFPKYNIVSKKFQKRNLPN